MLGFKRFDNAVVTISGIELAEKIKKGQFKTGSDEKESIHAVAIFPFFLGFWWWVSIQRASLVQTGSLCRRSAWGRERTSERTSSSPGLGADCGAAA
jgi:hypothetical protein